MPSDEDLKVNLSLDTTEFLSGVEQMRRGFENFGNSIGQSMRGIAHTVHETSALFDRLDIAQINVTTSSEAVARAQDNLAEATRKYGKDSDEARRATQELQRAHEQLDKAQIRSEMSAGLVAVQAVQLTSKVPAAVASLLALTEAEWSAAGAAAAFESTVTLGAAAIGIVAGIAAVEAALKGYEVEADRATQATITLTQAQEAQGHAFERLAGHIVKSLGGPSIEDILARTMKSAQASADSFLLAEDVKAQIAARNEATIRSELAKTEQVIAENRAKLADLPKSATDEDIAAWEKALSDATSFRDQLVPMLAQIAGDTAKADEDAKKAMAAQAKGLQDSLSQGLSSFGINLKSMSEQALVSLEALKGPMGALATQVAGATAQEDNLVAAALRSSEALRSQATVTRKKGETTDDFKARLLTMGYTEQQIAGIVTDTTQAFTLQTQAMNANAAAVSGLSAPGSSSDPLVALLSANALQLSMGTSGQKNAFLGAEQLQQWNSAQIAAVLEGRSAGGTAGDGSLDYLGAAGSEQRARFMGLLQQLVLSQPGTQWDSLLSSMGIKGLAHGGDMTVTRPSLFMAGEHGAESISVKPLALGGQGGGQDVSVVFQPGSIVVHGGGKHAADEILDELARRVKRTGVQSYY